MMCSSKSCLYSAGLARGLAKLRKIHFNWNIPMLPFLTRSFPLQWSSRALCAGAGRTDIGLTEGKGKVGTSSSLLGIQEQAEPSSLCRSSVGAVYLARRMPFHLAEAAAWELAGASQQKGVPISASPGNEELCFSAQKLGGNLSWYLSMLQRDVFISVCWEDPAAP